MIQLSSSIQYSSSSTNIEPPFPKLKKHKMKRINHDLFLCSTLSQIVLTTLKCIYCVKDFFRSHLILHKLNTITIINTSQIFIKVFFLVSQFFL